MGIAHLRSFQRGRMLNRPSQDFLLRGLLGKIPHHPCTGSLGPDGRKSPLTLQAREKVRRKRGA